jgi:glycosyltransferase involved in cell wall biosynthesis
MEPFSLVVPEALAAGTAVVASKRVGAAEWFELGRELLLFSPEAPEELDHALRCLRDEPELAPRLADAGRRKASQVFDGEASRSAGEDLQTASERSQLWRWQPRAAARSPEGGISEDRRRAA